MINDELKNAIIKQQGELLYTTLSEECCELAQASSKILRKKFYDKEFDIDNLLEEICDVEINIELIKEQLTKERLIHISKAEIEQKIEEWKKNKIEKITKIFLK